MTKRDLVLLAADKGNGELTQADILRAFDLMLESMSEALAKGEKITIANFGTFYVKDMKERNGTNPSTGEAIKIPPKKVVKFKPFEKIKKLLRDNPISKK